MRRALPLLWHEMGANSCRRRPAASLSRRERRLRAATRGCTHLCGGADHVKPLSRLRDRAARRIDEGPIAQQWEGEGRHRHLAIPHPSHPSGMGPFPLPLAGEGFLAFSRRRGRANYRDRRRHGRTGRKDHAPITKGPLLGTRGSRGSAPCDERGARRGHAPDRRRRQPLGRGYGLGARHPARRRARHRRGQQGRRCRGRRQDLRGQAHHVRRPVHRPGRHDRGDAPCQRGQGEVHHRSDRLGAGTRRHRGDQPGQGRRALGRLCAEDPR